MARRGMALLALAVGLVAAGPANAATPYGADPSQNGDTSFECSPCPEVLIQDTVEGVEIGTPAGVVSELNADVSGPFSVVVYRPSVRGQSVSATRVGTSATIQGRGLGVLTQAGLRLPVRSGDMVGLLVPTGSQVNATTKASSWFWASGGANNPLSTTQGGEFDLLYQVLVEADDDGDGFGDETQDGCPENASAHGACPIAPVPPPPAAPTAATKKLTFGRKVVARKGKVAIPLTNPNAADITGKLTLKLGKKKAGSAKYSIAGGSGKTVRVKLSKAARKRLKRKGKLKLKFTATARGKTGRTFTAKGRLTVTKPPKKKRAPTGGDHGNDDSGGGGGVPVTRQPLTCTRITYDSDGYARVVYYPC